MIVNVIVKYYKSRAGRSTGVLTKVVPALVIMWQTDHTYVVELLEPAFNYPKGHNYAVNPSGIADKLKFY